MMQYFVAQDHPTRECTGKCLFTKEIKIPSEAKATRKGKEHESIDDFRSSI